MSPNFLDTRCAAPPFPRREQPETRPEAPMPDLPRLIAFDADDLAVIAANLQDALVRVGDMAFVPQSKQFAMLASRFDWVRAAARKSGRPCCERARTGLH
ncbi:MAG: DUF2948 family protein, partial [Methylocella sp.]